MRSPHATAKSDPRSPQLEKACVQQWGPNTAKNKINKRKKEKRETRHLKEFSVFLYMGRCKSLGSLKSFLWYAPQLSWPSILFCFFVFPILNPLSVHSWGRCSGWWLDGPTSFVFWHGRRLFFIHRPVLKTHGSCPLVWADRMIERKEIWRLISNLKFLYLGNNIKKDGNRQTRSILGLRKNILLKKYMSSISFPGYKSLRNILEKPGVGTVHYTLLKLYFHLSQCSICSSVLWFPLVFSLEVKTLP